MRKTVLLAFGIMFAAAAAQAQVTAPATPAPQGVKPAELHPATPVSKSMLRLTRKFEKTNVSHTGRLTPAEAQASWPWAARHFAEIDQEHRGYLTLDQIHTWRQQHRHHRKRHASAGTASAPK